MPSLKRSANGDELVIGPPGPFSRPQRATAACAIVTFSSGIGGWRKRTDGGRWPLGQALGSPAAALDCQAGEVLFSAWAWSVFYMACRLSGCPACGAPVNAWSVGRAGARLLTGSPVRPFR